MINDILGTLAAIMAIIVGAFLLIIAGTLGGALIGWIVGLMFSDVIMHVLSAFGVNTVNLELWQIGAAAGFFGGFVKSNNFQNKT